MMRPMLVRAAAILALAAMLGLADDVQAQKKKKGLANSTWTGRETLPGYGPLTFKFPGPDKVTMIDAKEASTGRVKREGNEITLTFFDGNVVYTGVINGQTMSGKARNAQQSWTWEVTRQKKKKGKQ